MALLGQNVSSALYNSMATQPCRVHLLAHGLSPWCLEQDAFHSRAVRLLSSAADNLYRTVCPRRYRS